MTSDLFGVDTLYNSSTQELRRRLTFLEGRVALGDATKAERQEYEQLRSELTSSPVSRVRELGDDDQ